MSDSIHPWIRDYLISTAEQYGANLPSIPLAPKGKKTQLVEVRLSSRFLALEQKLIELRLVVLDIWVRR